VGKDASWEGGGLALRWRCSGVELVPSCCMAHTDTHTLSLVTLPHPFVGNRGTKEYVNQRSKRGDGVERTPL